MGLILFLRSNPPQWPSAFGGSGLYTCFGISLCRRHDFLGALGSATEDKELDRPEVLRIVQGHTLDIQAGPRLQDTSWTALHPPVPAIKTGTDTNTFLAAVK